MIFTKASAINDAANTNGSSAPSQNQRQIMRRMPSRRGTSAAAERRPSPQKDGGGGAEKGNWRKTNSSTRGSSRRTQHNLSANATTATNKKRSTVSLASSTTLNPQNLANTFAVEHGSRKKDSAAKKGSTSASSKRSLHSLECCVGAERDEVRAALMRHWTALDRARLHTFHLWLFVYSIAQIFLFHYLCHRVWSLGYLCFCLLFPSLVLVSFVLIRYREDRSISRQRRRLAIFSLISSISFPQERIAELSSLCSSMAISTLYQFFVLPRQRRLFLSLSVCFNVLNSLLIGAVLFASSDKLPFPESPSLLLLPSCLFQLVITAVGVICEANSASSRQTIAQKLTEAVHRRTELEALKNRQESLLLSVIPAYLTDKVSKQIFATSSAADFSAQNKNQKLFNELHVQAHENVSILFADIVNFTQLAAQLNAKDLVKTLNELYSKFDEDAQKLSCMRIKFLGDCYYCVSGMPVNRPSHADMCVLMGLEMIKTIRQVRIATGVNVDMRIGVHTGSVLCGILGLKKWQFDIWSDDVSFANHMESTGMPGALHISKKTKDMLMGKYNIVEAPQSQDPVMMAHAQSTYHILPDQSTGQEERSSVNINKRRAMELSPSHFDLNNLDSLSVDDGAGFLPGGGRHHRAISMKAKSVKMTEYWGEQTQALKPISARSRSTMRGLGTAQQSDQNRRRRDTVIRTTIAVENGNAKDANGNVPSECNGLSAPAAMFDESTATTTGGEETETGETERSKRRKRGRRDRSYYGAAGTLGAITVQSLTLIENNLGNLSTTSFRTIFHCTTGSCELSPFLLLPFISNREVCLKSECRTILFFSLPIALANYLLVYQNVPQKVKNLVTGQLLVSIGALLFICALESLCRMAKVLLTLVAFVLSLSIPVGQHMCLVLLAVTAQRLPVFSILWLPSCIAHMCSIFALYRLPYPLRCFLASVDCGLFLLLLILFSTSVSNVLQSAPIISCQVTIILVNIIALFLLLLFIARITEYERKVEASCNVAFKNEERDVQLMQDINKLLIENILPSSVAAKFLSHEQRNKDELYARDHENVCVMFASIPNFKNYWSECDPARKLECLRLLNEIVCEFDKLLSKPKFSCIEKIKTVASTYMAAAGLTDSDTADNSPERNSTVMAEFAQAMAAVLEQLNVDSFQNFELRIGLNVGPVVAGVLGQKPQYDIWGNSVNVASRMDSSGVIGHIQVNEETKQILSRKNGYQWTCRGEINVKGKGLMTTYLLKLKKRTYK
uniref:adenylate cyclase n=1 Tax=Globodera rostochiensis TaxID=31243 RepID=A0A914H1I7_GLORO